MTEPKWERLQTLFNKAVGLSGREREAFLEEQCGDDRELHSKLISLLDADELNADNKGTIPQMPNIVDIDAALSGTTIGNWRVLERVGVGGMGSVFRTTRADGGFEQEAALKVVKKGMDTESVVQRFRQERQILARLNHPNIARLLDGGVTEDGRPYFVMEFAHGLPITEYCDKHRLSVEQRLELFQKACDAVHYAHQSLVVHRDLKPGNIIVTDSGDLKLLDFGIAKLLDDSQDKHLTRTGIQIHTPAYAAPEQLLDAAITTVTDVYALGAILYELISGRRPFEVRRSVDEYRQLVLDGQPAKPSTAVTRSLATTGDRRGRQTAEQLSALRGARTEHLRRSLAGDLDTICLMALHREPTHRYASAEQMAADIRRHLDGHPVLARPDSMRYRVTKFYRRHRTGVVAAVAVIAAFTTMSVFYTQRLAEERDLALDEQRKASEVVRFVTGLFEVSDPSESRGDDLSARQLLDAGAVQINTELVDRPSVQATMRRVLGEVYYSLGSIELAEELLSAALQQQKDIYGDENLDVATSKIALGFIFQDRGDVDEAGVLYREALQTKRTLLGEEHPDVMEAISVLAFLEETKGNFDAAKRLYIDALDMGRRLYVGDSERTAEAMTNLAGLYRSLDRSRTAEPLLRDALAMQNRVYGGPHPESDDTKRQLAGLLRNTRRFEESKSLYLEVIESRTHMLGPDHVEVAHAWNSYSQLLSDMDQHEDAVAANKRFIEIMERAYDGPHPSLGAAYNNLAMFLVNVDDYDGAILNYRLSIEMQDAVKLPARHLNRSFPISGMASVFLEQERYAEAETIFRDMLALRREQLPEEHRLVSELKYSLGAALTGLGQLDEAEALLLDAYTRFYGDRDADDPRTRRTARRLAQLYELKGDNEQVARFRDAATTQ